MLSNGETLYVTIYSADFYNLTHIGVNCNTLGDLIERIIAQNVLDSAFIYALVREILAVSLAFKRFRSGNNPNNNRQICCFFYNWSRSPLCSL